MILNKKILSNDIHFLKCKAKINTSLILIPTIKSKRRTTTTTTRPTAKLAEEVGDNLVLDFSSGQPEMIANTANEVEVKSEEEVADSPAAKNAFSKFRELIELVGVNEVLKEAGNFSIFSPLNTAFDELDTSIEDVPLTTIRRWILKHFVKDFLFKRDMVNGPVSRISIFLTLKSLKKIIDYSHVIK